MAVNDVFRLACIGIGPSAQLLVNVHHYRQTSLVFGDDTGEDLINAWRSDVEAAWAATLSAAVSIVKYEARNLTQPLFGFDFSLSPVVPGDISGQASSPTAPTIVTWRTGLIGRSRRGRTYMWPTGESQVGGGQIEGSYALLVAAFANAALNITESVVGATYEKVVWSEVLMEANVITTFTAQEFQGTMRKRRAGVGS